MKRLATAILCFAMLSLPELAGGAEKPIHGGRLVFGIRNDITSLNPFIRTSSTNYYVRGLAYEALLDFDKTGKLVPSLAQSWSVSPDGKSYIFKLRPGVRFHNGKELTAEDVKWSADYALDAKNTASGFTILKNLQSVNVKDGLTVEFVLKQPMGAFLNLLAMVRSFPVVPKDSVPEGSAKVLTPPPGTGPFIFKEYKPSREMIFARNKTYWQKGLPYLDELVLKPVTDDQVRFISVRSGDLDIIERTPYAAVRKLLAGGSPDLKITEVKYAGYRRMLFNVADPPFNNLKLRQAVRYALDKKKYIEGAFWGFGEPVDQVFPKESPWRVKLPEIKTDPARAKTLLKDAGISPDLEVELTGLKSEEEELQVIQQQLTAAGFKAKVLVLERGARGSREGRGDFMMVLSGSDIPNDPEEEYPSEFGCAEEEVKSKNRTENTSGYCNPEVDRLMEEASKITDQKKRYDLFARVTRILHEEIPGIPLAFVPRFFTYHKKVRGFETDFDGRFNMTTAGFSRVWIER
ncbi:MAG TPA: ABC transporter substrate-binding protein [Candidatus Binatia bacterium]|jgi:ABC-type transport system substrate-binding protein